MLGRLDRGRGNRSVYPRHAHPAPGRYSQSVERPARPRRSAMNRRACTPLVGMLLFGFTSLIPSRQAWAQPMVHPTLFALTAGDFPSGSRIIRAGVESNRQLSADEAPHFGLPPQAVDHRAIFPARAYSGRGLSDVIPEPTQRRGDAIALRHCHSAECRSRRAPARDMTGLTERDQHWLLLDCGQFGLHDDSP
jgi:hypothetical protein